jgi:hypothetical protein
VKNLDLNKTQLYKCVYIELEEGRAMEGTETNREEEIRQLAYRLWQEEGRPDGYDVQHWLKAETIWLEEHRPRSKAEKSKPVRSKRTMGRKSSQTQTTATPQ